jgi:hypothetical protein
MAAWHRYCDFAKHKIGEDTELPEGTDPVQITHNGAVYEIDACERHQETIRKAEAAVQEIAELGTRLYALVRAGTHGPARNGSGGKRVRTALPKQMREWLRAPHDGPLTECEQGHTVNERGRIPHDFVTEYEVAH